MQQAQLTSLINTIVKNPQPQTAQPSQTASPPAAINKKPNKMLDAAKEIGITAGMGVMGGSLAGGVAALIPTKNIDRVSDVLCDRFIRAVESENPDTVKNLKVNLDSAAEQIQKAKEYVDLVRTFESTKAGTNEAKIIMQKLSDSAWALKQSAVNYIEKAVKGDNLLQSATKEARKIRTKDVMKNSISIGISTAFLVLLLNTLSGMFGPKSSKNDTKS